MLRGAFVGTGSMKPPEIPFVRNAAVQGTVILRVYDDGVLERSDQTGVSINGRTPKSSILMGFPIKHHPFCRYPIDGNPQINRGLSIAGALRCVEGPAPSRSCSRARATGQACVPEAGRCLDQNLGPPDPSGM